MRYRADLKTPIAGIHGPKVMLIDETAGSGGDLLPWMFRKFDLEGVAPDIEVEQTPKDVIAGKDPQLEKAIEMVLAELAKAPPVAPQRPAFPLRAKPRP